MSVMPPSVPKTIRRYEEIGLIAPARAGNGYRNYSGGRRPPAGLLRRARNLGFSIDDSRQLMGQDRRRASHLTGVDPVD